MVYMVGTGHIPDLIQIKVKKVTFAVMKMTSYKHMSYDISAGFKSLNAEICSFADSFK